uniref:Uncharacterized protein n=1 Tax=Anguilla anguilla TaxID=7936 RepID=A0A0E9WHV2_ANGAN
MVCHTKMLKLPRNHCFVVFIYKCMQFCFMSNITIYRALQHVWGIDIFVLNLSLHYTIFHMWLK